MKRNAGIDHLDYVPNHVPNRYTDSLFCVNVLTGLFYRWDVDAQAWRMFNSGIETVTGSTAPTYVPVGLMPRIVINESNEIYRYTDATGWALASAEAVAATPAITLTAGTYTGTQTTTITSATEGAEIRYTVDGSTPSAASTLYTGAVTIASSQTIKAIAIKAGISNSAVATSAFVITVTTPTFSPVAGSYAGAQTVTISTVTTGTTIYYTVDGSTPTTGSTLYTAPISVATSKTVKALAVKTGLANSAVGSAAYTIT